MAQYENAPTSLFPKFTGNSRGDNRFAKSRGDNVKRSLVSSFKCRKYLLDNLVLVPPQSSPTSMVDGHLVYKGLDKRTIPKF